MGNYKSPGLEPSDLDELSINTIRFLSIDAVQRAKSGHPGMPMGAAPMAYVLWDRFLAHNPSDPGWFNRDRFVLSAGHGSMLLYSLLYLSGYDLSIEDIKQFRQWNSNTPGHPELGITPGVEVTTGPLGQGFGNSVGMAVSEAFLASCYNRPGFDIINHFTYVIASDGDLMEGVASEAASLAGHLKLGKLICLYDDNRLTLSAATDLTFTEDRARRFEAYGWHTEKVEDGNDPESIASAIDHARNEKERPSLILVHTHLGYGSPNKQDKFESHGSPLGEEEVGLTKKALGWPDEPPFYIPETALKHFRKAIERGNLKQQEWNEKTTSYRKEFPGQAEELMRILNGEIPPGWDSGIPLFKPDSGGLATRTALGRIMNITAPKLPSLIGGSADLDPSTFTVLKGLGDFENPGTASKDVQGSAGGIWSYAGRNIHFGVREHGMGAILNGMAVHGGVIPFGATFLVFSDYMRPPIRLASLMGLHVIYIFTHDSIGLGEDGPTHQPVEQLAGLRTVPGLIVIRPCDANETAETWRIAVTLKDHPVAIILTRQNVPVLDRSELSAADGLLHGAYILAEPPGKKIDIILIASGSEVHIALNAGLKLREQGIAARVVSMPSFELFDREPIEYRNKILPPGVRARLAIEAGSSFGWHRYTGECGGIISLDRFGSSAPGDKVMKESGFNADNAVGAALDIIKNLQ